MTIGGLTNILCSDCLYFEPLKLRNSKLVINAYDFSGWLYEPLSSFYGGEYLAFFWKVQRTLNNFKKCNVVPCFILQGCNELRGDELNSCLRKLSVCIDNIMKSADTPGRKIGIPPFLCNQVVVDVCKQLHVDYVCVPYSSVRASVALAAYLNCPVITSCTECFLLTNKSILSRDSPKSPPTILPLQFISREVTAEETDNSSSIIPFLSAHAFRAHLSELNTVGPIHLPLLAAMFGCDQMTNCRLPPTAVSHLSHVDSSEHAKQRRWNALLKWFSQFPDSSMKPVEELINCYPDGESRDKFIKQLTDVFSFYNYHSHIDGKKVASRLGWSSEVPDSPNSVDNGECTVDEIGIYNVFELLKGYRNKALELPDYTNDWPLRLRHAFQNAKVSPGCVQPLYVEHGALCLSVRTEDPENNTSVHRASLPLRVFHYRLLIGIESYLEHNNKLVGLQPHAVEYVRHGKKLGRFEIPVEPLRLNYDRDHTDQVLINLFGLFPTDKSIEPEWCYAFAVALSLWRECENSLVGDSSLDQDSVALAVAICAIVTSYTEQLDESLLQHFDRLINTEEQEARQCQVCLDIVHRFNSLQIVYSELHSLVNLIESLLPITHESELFHFQSPWISFPSGRLVYWIAKHVETLPPPERRRTLLRIWLPRLYQVNGSAKDTAVHLCNIASTFDRVMDLAVSVRVRPLPEVNFQVTEVTLENKPASTPRNSIFSRGTPIELSGGPRLQSLPHKGSRMGGHQLIDGYRAYDNGMTGIVKSNGNYGIVERDREQNYRQPHSHQNDSVYRRSSGRYLNGAVTRGSTYTASDVIGFRPVSPTGVYKYEQPFARRGSVENYPSLTNHSGDYSYGAPNRFRGGESRRPSRGVRRPVNGRARGGTYATQLLERLSTKEV